MRRCRTLVVAVCIVSPGFLATSAAATTFVRVPDPRLARGAAVIVDATILSREPAPPAGRPETDYVIRVERVLQGSAPNAAMVVRVPGGAAGDGSLRVWGAPSFRAGERALLFLEPGADGSYRLPHLMLGAFHEVIWAGRRLAVHDLSQAAELIETSGGERRLRQATEEPRDWERFSAWLEARANGTLQATAVSTDYRLRLPPAELAQVAALAAPGRSEPGLRAATAAIAWFASLAADPELAATASAALAGLAAAPDLHAATAPPLSYGGATSSTAGLDRFDGQTSVLLLPRGSDRDLPPFDCAAGSGGLVSLSGSWFDRDGQVQGGSVILAAGLGCLFAGAAGAPAPGLPAILDHDLPQALLLAADGAHAPATNAVRPQGFRQPEAAQASSRPSSSAAAAQAAVAVAPGAAASAALAPAQATAAAASAPLGRGYQARACGFDMNHNGAFGEPADCHVCDGVTANPYGSGTPPNLIYVSCQTGADSSTCGSPANPCGSIQYAWNYRTGPPSSSSADIICFRGTCHENGIMPGVSGKAGTYSLPATGSEAIPWQLSTHPTMLVGWDYNRNGQYPPYDTQDVAVLDGTGFAQALLLNGNQVNSDVELAHFTVRNYGTGVNANPTGFIELSDGAFGTSSRIYIHDLSIQDVNRGKPLDSPNIIFDFFGSNAQLTYLAVENVEVLNAGGYLARGAAPSSGPDNGPYRFKNVTWNALGCNASGAGACADPANEAHAIGFKLWGYLSQIEILDSVLNLNTAAWTPYGTAFGSTAFVAAQCSQRWTIRNNEIDDFKVGLTVQGYAAGYCDGPTARPVDFVTFDRNTFRNTYPNWQWGDNGVQILGGGPNPQTSIGTVLVSNNFFSSTPGWQSMAYINAGNAGGPDPGILQFANNTMISNLYRTDFGAITLQKSSTFAPQAILVKNNVFGGMGAGGEQNIHADYAPAAWDAAANVFDPNGTFVWNGSPLASLAAWQQATAHDLTARECVPSLVNASAGDFHLLATDSCARGLGVQLAGLFSWDIDGSPRPPVGAWDAGASEGRAATASHFYTVTPCRVLDTRTLGAPLDTSSPSSFPVAGRCGIPASATAVAFNVTAVSATAAVDVQVYPGDRQAPGTNVVSASPSRPVRAAAAVVALAAGGAGSVGVLPSFKSPGQVDLLLDVSGYFAP